MADHNRTIQIRVREYESSEKRSNEGVALVTRARPKDRVWFLYYPNGKNTDKEAVFTRSPFKDGVTTIPVQEMTDALLKDETTEHGVEVTAASGGEPYEFVIHNVGADSELLKGQIDIDP